jgi:hypothetical protein
MAMPTTAVRRERTGESAVVRRRRRRKRWRQGMLWLLTVVTTGVLLVIAGFVKEISKVPAVARPAALTATAQHPTPSPSHPRTSPGASGTTRDLADPASGLSYALLSAPWRQGCPGILDTTVFSWTAGENAVAGRVNIGGTVIDWHGNACSGRLQHEFAYSGPADLAPVTMGVADAIEPAYYRGLQHTRTVQSSSAIQVSGHQAWVVTFAMKYKDAARDGLPWTSEQGAVVVVDRGAGRHPAVFYTSVPNNLGTSDVSTLVSSLRLGR